MRTWIVVGACALAAASVTAADAPWPQFAGPTRDFNVTGVDITTAWPESGPKRLWQHNLGDGYSSIVVADDTLYTMYHADGKDHVVALSPEDGAVRWDFAYDAPFPPDTDTSFGPGPRSTPLAAGERLVTVSVGGLLHCLDRKSGKPLWQHDLVKEYGGNIPTFGYAASPLLFDGRVIVAVGGEGKGVVAFRLADGSIDWATGDDKCAYSSPVIIEVDGQKQLVVLMAKQIVALKPENGDRLWTFAHETFADVNAALPVWGKDNLLFVTSAYRTGSRMLKLNRNGDGTDVEQIWNAERIGVHHGAVVRVDDMLIGSVGMMGPAFLVGVDAKSGEQLWKQRGVAKANVMRVGDRFLVLGEDGELMLAKADRKGLEVLCKAAILERSSWTPPTVVGSRVYVRDRKSIVALDLKG